MNSAPTPMFTNPMSMEPLPDLAPQWSIPQAMLQQAADMPRLFESKFEPWLEAPLLDEPVCFPRPLERVSSHGSTLSESNEQSVLATAGDCKQCLGDHSQNLSVIPVPRTGRPVVDRVPSQEELLSTFKQKLRLSFHKINQKFSNERARTDKYRTMTLRMLKRVLGEVVCLIGIDSYAKSPKLDRYLPEYNKRFEQMR